MSGDPLTVVVVALAGGVGAVLRHLAAVRLGSRGVLLVNAAGSLVAGVALALVHASALDQNAAVLVTAGFAGGLTTFSAVSLEAARLVARRRLAAALGAMLGNLAAGGLAAALGYLVARALTGG